MDMNDVFLHVSCKLLHISPDGQEASPPPPQVHFSSLLSILLTGRVIMFWHHSQMSARSKGERSGVKAASEGSSQQRKQRCNSL